MISSLKKDAPSVPLERIPQVIQRFVYDPNVSEEKVKLFVKHWHTVYQKYKAAMATFEDEFGGAAQLAEALKQDIVLPFSEPINSQSYFYDVGRVEFTGLALDEKVTFQNIAKRMYKEYQYRNLALTELAKQSNNKYTTLDSLFPISKRELEDSCNFRRFSGNEDDQADKVNLQITATVKRVLEFLAREETLSKHLSHLGYNYKFMSMPKEVVDYINGKSDLTFHQVVMKAIKDYTNPYADPNFIYTSLRFLTPQDKRKVALELYSHMFAKDENEPILAKRKEPANPAIAKLKVLKGRKRKAVTKSVLHSIELSTLHKYITALLNEQQKQAAAAASSAMQE